MPLFEYLCKGCQYEWEELVRDKAPVKCPRCEDEHITKLTSAFGGYSGNMGGASTRPKHAGSFSGRKKEKKS